MTDATNPILAEVVRGNWVENRHRGAFVVIDAGGRVIASAGDIERPIFPRSAWNQAVRQGRVTTIDAGPMRHMGLGDYISRSAKLPSGQPHVEWTVETLAGIIERIAAHEPASGDRR